MKVFMGRWLGIAGIMVLCVGPSFAEEQQQAEKVLPMLLIKGKVISVEAKETGSGLLKIKDRYGFETPIYLGVETAISQSGNPITADQLTVDMNVEVEYNFDVNTAKRHAVAVRVTEVASPMAAPPSPQPQPAPVEATPAPETPITPVQSNPSANTAPPAPAAPTQEPEPASE